MRVRKRAWATQVLQENTLVINDAPEKKGKWREYFGNDNPIYVEIGCGKGGHNFPFKPMLAHQRNQSGMVDMSMCQKNIINLSCGNRNLLILI